MKKSTVLALGVALSLVTLVSPSLDAASGKSVNLRELMSPDWFSRAGLAKLTASELAALEQWLGIYTQVVTEAVRSKSVTPPSTSLSRSMPSSTPDVIETCIEGDFEGWEGETIFKLCNSQIWQQSEYSYTYHYAYRPEVIIYKTASGYRMKVEDVAETIRVERIK